MPLSFGNCYLATGVLCLRKVVLHVPEWVQEAQKPSLALLAETKPRVSEHCSFLQQQVTQRPRLVKQGQVFLHACCGLEVRVGEGWHN